MTDREQIDTNFVESLIKIRDEIASRYKLMACTSNDGLPALTRLDILIRQLSDSSDHIAEPSKMVPVSQNEGLVKNNLLNIIHKKDNGYELVTIGCEFNLTGDDPYLFVEKLDKAYDLSQQPVSQFQKRLENLNNLIKIQTGEGCDNDYMYGMANGLICAKSLFDDKKPEYIAQQPVSGWQPIETAPKDGTIFLAVEEDEYILASWEDHGCNTTTGEPGWVTGRWDDAERCFTFNPTRWQPLPT